MPVWAIKKKIPKSNKSSLRKNKINSFLIIALIRQIYLHNIHTNIFQSHKKSPNIQTDVFIKIINSSINYIPNTPKTSKF